MSSVKIIAEYQYHAPDTLEKMLELLDEMKETASILNGGTDLVPKMKGRVLRPAHVLSMNKLKKMLSYKAYDDQNGLRFGSAISLRDLEKWPVLQEKYPALYQGIHCMASTQIRNMGTVAGNICNAVPSADTAPALLALGAKVKARSIKDERLIHIEEFFTGVCKTQLAPNEFVVEIQIPAPSKNSGSTYEKFTVRRSLELALVGSAVQITVENGVCKDVRIGLGAVGATPVRAYNAEAVLKNQTLNEEIIETTARAASDNDCSPISDLRASKDYRKEMVYITCRDAIKKSLKSLNYEY
jgi:carbon-monoxide dehydrogenase medium subunit